MIWLLLLPAAYFVFDQYFDYIHIDKSILRIIELLYVCAASAFYYIYLEVKAIHKRLDYLFKAMNIGKD